MNPWHARPRNWVLTAAAVAALVCAAAWPLPTGYAAGTVIATCALWYGVRKFLTERRPDPAVEPATAEQPSICCCVCGGPKTVYENCNGLLFCWPCADCPCGQNPCVRTGINDPAVSNEAAELTAEEARALADDLSLQLYRAQDALAFVGEMCDIADEHRGVRGEPATVTTARVREWLKGAQCARQAGLVIPPDSAEESGR